MSWPSTDFEMEIELELQALRKVAMAAEFMLGCLPCRCDEAYKSRSLQDPRCPCDDLEPVRLAVKEWRALESESTPSGEK